MTSRSLDDRVRSWILGFPGEFKAGTKSGCLRAAMTNFGEVVPEEDFEAVLKRLGYAPVMRKRFGAFSSTTYWQLALPNPQPPAPTPRRPGR